MSDVNGASAPAPASNVTTVDLSQKAPVAPQENQEQNVQPKPQDDKFAPKFAALSRKEKELRERESKWKSEAETIKSEAQKAKEEAQQFRDKYGRFASLEETLKTDKRAGVRWLLDQGLSTEELSDILLEEMNPDPEKRLQRTTSEIEKRLQQQIKALEEKLTAKEQAELEKQKQAEKDNFDKTVKQVKSEVKDFVDSSDGYELIKLSGEYETVFEVMQAHYDEQVASGVAPEDIKLLSYEEAANYTESYLEEDARKKYEAKRAKQAPQTKPETTKKTSPTLSNTLSTEVSTQVEAKPKTREESLARAAKMLKFIEE